MKILLLISLLTIGFLTGCYTTNGASNLSASERAELIAESCKALHALLQIVPSERDGFNIPKRLWGAAILRLKPLRVTNDHLHIRLVLLEKDDFEEGLYVSNPISSHAPEPNEFTELVKLGEPADRTFGTLYRYRSVKSKAP